MIAVFVSKCYLWHVSREWKLIIAEVWTLSFQHLPPTCTSIVCLVWNAHMGQKWVSRMQKLVAPVPGKHSERAEGVAGVLLFTNIGFPISCGMLYIEFIVCWTSLQMTYPFSYILCVQIWIPVPGTPTASSASVNTRQACGTDICAEKAPICIT